MDRVHSNASWNLFLSSPSAISLLAWRGWSLIVYLPLLSLVLGKRLMSLISEKGKFSPCLRVEKIFPRSLRCTQFWENLFVSQNFGALTSPQVVRNDSFRCLDIAKTKFWFFCNFGKVLKNRFGSNFRTCGFGNFRKLFWSNFLYLHLWQISKIIFERISVFASLANFENRLSA